MTDDYYLFTREAPGERLMVVFYKGDKAKNLNVELADTSIANARGFTALNSGPGCASKRDSIAIATYARNRRDLQSGIKNYGFPALRCPDLLPSGAGR